MNAITLFVVAVIAALGAWVASIGYLGLAIALWGVAAVVAQSLKMANTWQKFVVLRAGKLQGVRGPGLFAIIPVIDKERGTTILMPSSMVDSMNPAAAVAVALAAPAGAPRAVAEKPIH